MGRVESSVEIEAPIEKVFEFYADPKSIEKAASEDAELRVEIISETEDGVGSIFRLSGVMAGRKTEAENEVVEFEENRRIRSRQTKGDMKRFDVTTVFEGIDRGTRVTTTFDYELPYSVLGKILDKLKYGKEIERTVKASNEKAKTILEEG